MSFFKLICEDEATPFAGPSKITQQFETDDLVTILGNMTKFLQCTGYLSGNQLLELGRDIDLSGLSTEDLDEYTENLFTGTPIPKE